MRNNKQTKSKMKSSSCMITNNLYSRIFQNLKQLINLHLQSIVDV